MKSLGPHVNTGIDLSKYFQSQHHMSKRDDRVFKKRGTALGRNLFLILFLFVKCIKEQNEMPEAMPCSPAADLYFLVS